MKIIQFREIFAAVCPPRRRDLSGRLDSGSPRALAGKKRRSSKRLRERSKIRSSDNCARSGRNDGPLENPYSRRIPQTESRHSGKEQNPAEKLSAISEGFHHPVAQSVRRISHCECG